jgi:hypothetical protein
VLCLSSSYCDNSTVTVQIGAQSRDTPHARCPSENEDTTTKISSVSRIGSIQCMQYLIQLNVTKICESHLSNRRWSLNRTTVAPRLRRFTFGKPVLAFTMAKKKSKGSSAISNGKAANGGAAAKSAKKAGTKASTAGPHWIHLVLAVLSFLVGILSPPILQYMQAKSGSSAR